MSRSASEYIFEIRESKNRRRVGIASALLKQGIQALGEMNPGKKIFCDVSSRYVLRIIEKLPEELRASLEIRKSYLLGDLADDNV